MLTSITPLGERGRGNRWWVTTAWLMVGHVVGGLGLGAAMASVSAVLGLGLGRPSDTTVVLVVALATVVAALGDLLDLQPPGRRQVDERWLTSYRGWVYGVGFGAQLGFGLVTVVNTLLLGVVVLGGVLLAPAESVLVGFVYGIVRGVGASLSGWVRTVGDLRRLHRVLDRGERMVTWASLAAVALVAVGAVAIA